jgi:hypothetical protein
MRQIKLELIALFLLVIAISTIQAQDAIPASGGVAVGIGGTSGYSVGLCVYTSINGTNGSVAQGVQQPYEISVVNGIKEFTGFTLKSSAYPNPATDFLFLKIEYNDIVNLSYKLFDVNGKLIANKHIVSTETKIPMNQLVPSAYFLTVIQDKKEVKTFKIIKN